MMSADPCNQRQTIAPPVVLLLVQVRECELLLPCCCMCARSVLPRLASRPPARSPTCRSHAVMGQSGLVH